MSDVGGGFGAFEFGVTPFGGGGLPPPPPTGSLADIVARIQRWLPTRWFPPQSVNSDGSVPRAYVQAVGASANLVSIFNSIQYAIAQSRIASSTDGFVDLFAYDYFGGNLPRFTGESDAAYIVRIEKELTRLRNTRQALINVVQDYTGNTPQIYEPWRPADCGGYDTPTAMGFNEAGTWSWSQPLWIVFMTMPFPNVSAFAGMGGLDSPTAAGFNEPTAIGLTDPSTYIFVGVSITTLLEAINRVRAAGIQICVQFVGNA